MLSTDSKKELERRSKELCKQNSPTKNRKSATTKPPTKKPKTTTKVQGKKTKKRPVEKNQKVPGTASKKQQKLAEIHRAQFSIVYGRKWLTSEHTG